MAAAKTRARSLEITVLSAEDLRVNKKPIKNNAFVVVRTGGGTSTKSQYYYSTKMDATGENYPIWDEKLHVELPHHADHLQVEVHRRSSHGDERFIGAARIPASDFIGDYTPEKYLHFLSYRLRDAQGQKNGIVHVSVRVTSSPASSSSGCSTSSSQVYSCGSGAMRVPEFGIPVVVGQTVERHATVTGVPVWSPNSCS